MRSTVRKVQRRPRIKFNEFKKSLIEINNPNEKFFILPKRRNMVWLVNPVNWGGLQSIKTEHFGGHKGVRRHESLEVKVKKPGTNLARILILKPAQIPNKRLQELFGLERFREEARIVTEAPIGLCRIAEVWYTLTLKLEGQTLKKLGDVSNGSVVDAAKLYGKAFNAGLLQNDSGIKHIMASRKRLRLFDLEFATRAKNKTQGLSDFKSFFVSAIEGGLISDRDKAFEVIGAFCKVTGVKENVIINLVKTGIDKRQKMYADFNINPRGFMDLLLKRPDKLEEMQKLL